MADPLQHAQSSVRRFGGRVEDYIDQHRFYDETKGYHPDFRHRALRHHSEGIALAERVFGPFITNSDGRQVSTRQIGEQHVKEDLGWIPSAGDWLKAVQPKAWMMRSGARETAEPPIRDSQE